MKCPAIIKRRLPMESLSARRVWIEIRNTLRESTPVCVTLREEGVD